MEYAWLKLNKKISIRFLTVKNEYYKIESLSVL